MSVVDEETFNAAAGKAWSDLHRRSKIRADRATGFRGLLLARVWEKQKRGLAHLHGVIAVSSPGELAWARAYLETLRELAPVYGFGFVDGWGTVSRNFWPGDQAGAYLSSYFVSGRGRKGVDHRECPGSEPPAGSCARRRTSDSTDGGHDALAPPRSPPVGVPRGPYRFCRV